MQIWFTSILQREKKEILKLVSLVRKKTYRIPFQRMSNWNNKCYHGETTKKTFFLCFRYFQFSLSFEIIWKAFYSTSLVQNFTFFISAETIKRKQNGLWLFLFLPLQPNWYMSLGINVSLNHLMLGFTIYLKFIAWKREGDKIIWDTDKWFTYIILRAYLLSIRKC